MKKAKNYSFVILLSVMMISSVLYVAFSGSDKTDYREIKVANGDSLWSLAEKYKTLHNMDEIEFIKWVQDENNLINTKILPGEQLTIPVPALNAKSHEKLQLADGE